MRLQQIDFLRGIAVLLVVLFHFESTAYLNIVGWMGVDLFFVLSGYLISSLIFKELKTFGSFNPKRFLIRRGFKIYPTFYFFLCLSLILRVVNQQDIPIGYTIYEATFMRNFLGGYWAHTWSLCVEEHFYFLVAVSLYFIPYKHLKNIKNVNIFFAAILLVCLLLRVGNYFLELKNGESYFFNGWARRVQTFYCLDALSFGVLISYNLNFNFTQFTSYFKAIKKPILVLAVLSVIILPYYFTTPLLDCFIKSLIYISFGIILTAFLVDEKLFQMLQLFLTRKLLAAISYIGIFSYPIYLFHILIRDYVVRYLPFDNKILLLLSYLSISILSGIWVYFFIEKFFLKIRDKYYPSKKRIVSNDTLIIKN